MNLNLGCGDNEWGDIRLDIDYQTQTGIGSKLNLMADAHYLPFKDKSFTFVRCHHVLEHLKDPRRVIAEIHRITDHASIIFPTGDGYKNELVWQLSNLRFHGVMHAYRTRSRGVHLWIIHPDTGVKGYFELFSRWFRQSRHFRFLRRVPLPKLEHEWIIEF